MSAARHRDGTARERRKQFETRRRELAVMIASLGELLDRASLAQIDAEEAWLAALDVFENATACRDALASRLLDCLVELERIDPLRVARAIGELEL